jgi:SAM-dependent methyltransferase
MIVPLCRGVKSRSPNRRCRLSAASAPARVALHRFIGHHAPMPLDRAELDRIAALTLAHYGERADDFWAGTRDHDVSQNVTALLRHLPGPAPQTLLDLGCGPGRDLKTFAALGHTGIGLEGEPRFAAMARDWSGCEVWEQNLFDMNLPAERFDGVFANAVLFHVPVTELPRVLRQLHDTLRPEGVLFSSNPRGEGQEGWRGGRYGAWHSLEGWRAHMSAAGFSELEHFYRPEGLRREQQPWLASVWRRSVGQL